MKPLIWQVYDAGDTAEIFDTDIAHCLTSAHMYIFPSVLPCKHPSQPAWKKRMTWNSVTKFISKKNKYGLLFLKRTARDLRTVVSLLPPTTSEPIINLSHPKRQPLELFSKSYHPGQSAGSRFWITAVAGVSSLLWRARKYFTPAHFKAFHRQA